ncbi:hypothetical protein Tco_0448834 [Tanacetum coccineum]
MTGATTTEFRILDEYAAGFGLVIAIEETTDVGFNITAGLCTTISVLAGKHWEGERGFRLDQVRPLPYFRRRPTAKGVGLRVADSHTGNHLGDDFTPL